MSGEAEDPPVHYNGAIRKALREEEAVEIPATFTARQTAGDVRVGLSKLVWGQYGGLEDVPDSPDGAYFLPEEGLVVIDLPEAEGEP